jgi:hypothetical protein
MPPVEWPTSVADFTPIDSSSACVLRASCWKLY